LPAPPGLGMKKRIAFVFIATMFALCFLAGRVAYLQFVRGGELSGEALEVRTREMPVEAKRGAIYDRKGRELAISVNVDSAYAVPAEIENPDEVAAAVAEVLDMDRSEVRRRLTKDASFVWIKREIDDEASAELKRLDIDGIDFTQESRRFYPKGSLACHVLGFAGIDNQGLEGIEVSFDRELRGVPGKIVVEFDARGREIPQAVHRFVEPRDGLDLVLTIDEVIQYVAERELEAAVTAANALKGVCVVLDPRTGEVLAMASRPAYDPNRYSDYRSETWRNTVIADTMPPGSTFKPITAAAALEEGAVDWGTHFYCPGAIKVPGAVISDVSAHGSQDMTGIIVRSCNVGFVNVVNRLGADRFYKYVHAFGLDEKTGIRLPGEGAGIFPPLEQVKPVDLAVMSFGQTMTLTPLRLAVALSAIVNDGVMMKPLIAKELRDASGAVVRTFEPCEARRVISKDTANELVQALVKVVDEGTGRRARIEGYSVGGKTGTAQKVVEGRIVPGKYIGCFWGFAPASDPRVSILMMIDEPEGSYYGGVVAAPYVASALRDVLRYLEVPPDRAAGEGTSARDEDQQGPEPVEVPAVVGTAVPEAVQQLRARGLSVRVEGSGDAVSEQVPPAGAEVPPGSEVLLRTTTGEGRTDQEVSVPDVRGLTMRRAADVLGRVGLMMKPDGTGVAVEQEPAPDAVVAPGSTVAVRFEPPER